MFLGQNFFYFLVFGKILARHRVGEEIKIKIKCSNSSSQNKKNNKSPKTLFIFQMP